LQEKLAIIKIDVDKNSQVASSHRVQGVPTLVLYKDGQQVWRQSGLLQRSELIKVIQSYLS